MRILLHTLILSLALTLAGCASPERNGPAFLWAVEGARTPNLALGPTAESNRLAESFAGRSDWPSVDAGYQLEDVSFFSTFTYDDQSFYDRYSGGFSRQSVTERTATIVR